MAKEADKNKKVRRPTAQKRDIQNSKKRLRNKMFRSEVKTAIRRFEETIKLGNKETTNERLSDVYRLMDKGVKHGVYKMNKASRTKGRLASRTVAA